MVLNIAFFLINILILAVIYILLIRRINKLTNPERITETLSGDLDIILSEINQATERNILVIEDKISELEDIIDKAEKRITLLKKVEVSAPPLPKPTVAPVEKTENTQLALDIPVAELEEPAGELTYSHLNKLNTLGGMVTSMTVPEKNDSESIDIKEKVISLHRNGIDSAIIASNVGINRGEVELIISLYTQVRGGQD